MSFFSVSVTSWLFAVHILNNALCSIQNVVLIPSSSRIGKLEEDLIMPKLAARRSNQSILKGISPECSLEGLMLKLKLQYFGHLMQRVDSLEKTLMLGKIGDKRRRG